MHQVQAPPRSRFARALLDNNPFYVLSAMCMLFGVFAINDSLDWSPIALGQLLTMILTLNVYEALLIGLAVLLLTRDVRRDATLLLLIEAFFLADVGFLNMEIFTLDLGVALVVNALLLAAAVVKVALIFRAANVPLLDGRFTFVAVSLAVLYGMSGLFAVVSRPHDTRLDPLVAYSGWWIAGGLMVLFAVLVRSFEIFRRRINGRPAGMDAVVSRMLLALPVLSLIAHLSLSHWVYKSLFHPADLSPLLLGAAVAIGHCGDRHVASLAWRMRMQLVLPFVAVAFAAIKFPEALVFDVGSYSISPLRITLWAATIVYLDALWLHRHVLFACAAAGCFAMSFMGHSVKRINDNSLDVATRSAGALERLVPDTLAEWGMISIAAAFVLLGIGALISLTRRPAVEGAAVDEGEVT